MDQHKDGQFSESEDSKILHFDGNQPSKQL